MIRPALLAALLIAPPAGSPAFAAPADAEALDVARGAFAGACAELAAAPQIEARHDLTVTAGDGRPTDMTLWQLGCDRGAYNLSSVFVGWTSDTGLHPLFLPRPVFQAQMADPANPDSPALSVQVTGWGVQAMAVNPEFLPAELTLHHHAKYRGLGDAFEIAAYRLTPQGFVLLRFSVDPSYDGEMADFLLFGAP